MSSAITAVWKLTAYLSAGVGRPVKWGVPGGVDDVHLGPCLQTPLATFTSLNDPISRLYSF